MKFTDYFLYLLALCLFIMDVLTPLGVAAGTPYGLLVSATLWSNKQLQTIYIAVLCIILTLIGYSLSSGIVSPNYAVITNRSIAILIIIVSALLVIQRKKADIKIAYLSALTLTDPLTKIKNRLAFTVDIKDEISRARRYKRTLSIAFFDLDNFKQINDTQGHAKGDEILCSFAKLISEQIRLSDKFYRIGGDEFVIVFVETPLNESRDMCNLLREVIEKSDIPSFTVSVGVTSLQSSDSNKELLERADKALYKAKAAGKNQVSLIT